MHEQHEEILNTQPQHFNRTPGMVTVDNNYKFMEQHEEMPPHWDKVPDMVKVDSDYKFEVTINGDNNNWLYVPQLEKIFIKMTSVMNINISFIPITGNLSLRAMILYTSPDEMHLAVKRCANHRESDKSKNVHHILRSCHTRAYYEGNDDGTRFKERLSVVVPLGTMQANEDGLATEQIGLQFLCQNSCVSGINRRSTSIIFTLETQKGHIVGKKVVQFKVCSCPKRDADREAPQKRVAGESGGHSRGKRPKYQLTRSEAPEIKTEPRDEAIDSSSNPSQEPVKEVTVTLTLPTEIMRYVLDAAYNKIAGDMAKHKDKSEHYWKHLKHVEKLQEAYSNH